MIRQIPLRPLVSTTGRLLSTSISRATPFASTRCLSTETATRTAKASSSPPPPPPSRPLSTPLRKSKPTSPPSKTASTPTAPAPLKPRRLTYLVERTLSNNLAVYDDAKSGGTRKFTQIRKIVGNAQDLKKDIIADFGFKKDDVKVNPVTGHLIIKGHHLKQVKEWLSARGF